MAKKKKKLSSSEAKHICLRYIISWATEASRMDSDFHAEIPESYVLDKQKLEQRDVGGKMLNFYYPTKSEIKVITEEMQKIATKLILERVKAKERYEKSGMKTR